MAVAVSRQTLRALRRRSVPPRAWGWTSQIQAWRGHFLPRPLSWVCGWRVLPVSSRVCLCPDVLLLQGRWSCGIRAALGTSSTSMTPSGARLQTQSCSEVRGLQCMHRGWRTQSCQSWASLGPPLPPVCHLQTSRGGDGVPCPVPCLPRSPTWCP